MKYGYARISADGQSIDAQVRQLKAAGARQVFREVASGAKTDRAQLRRVLAQLDAGPGHHLSLNPTLFCVISRRRRSAPNYG